ncbi:MAG: hypothetical protein ACLTK0_09785 [Anaerovoracaceae bacterium]
MKYIKTEDAVGHVMCHDITKIVPEALKDDLKSMWSKRTCRNF